MKTFYAAAAFLASALALTAAVPPPGNPVTVPALGLKIPLPNNAQSVPLPPAEIHTYRYTQGDRSWTAELYEAHELWFAAQHVAEWTLPSRNGTRVFLGAATIAPPVGIGAAHVTREQFEAFTNSPLASMESPDAASLGAWLSAFAGCRLGEPQSLTPPRTTRLRNLVRYPAERTDVSAWLLRFDRNGGYAHLPDVWFAVVSVAPSPAAGAAERDFLESAVLANIAPMGRFEGRETAAERLARQRDRQRGAVRQHPSRDAAHAAVAGHADLKALDSEDFVLIYKDGKNGSASQRLAKDLLEDLQLARTLYSGMFPGFADTSDNVSVIYLPASDAEYEAHVGEDHAWSSGLYNGGTRELSIRPAASGRAGNTYARTISTAYHEGFHQYIHQATGLAQPAVWFNEGFACFFETLSFRNGRAAVDEDLSRLRILEPFLKTKQPIPLQTLVSMSYESFYAGTDDERLFKYALAWSFAYFLERGAPLVRNKPYAGVLPTYLTALRETGDGAEATRLAFANVDFTALERDFREFWTTPRSRSFAKRDPLIK